MGEHKTIVCRNCMKIVRNCRCVSKDKKKEYIVCDACKLEDYYSAGYLTHGFTATNDRCKGI